MSKSLRQISIGFIASIYSTLIFSSCTSTALLSVNHFQDAKTLERGETRYIISGEQALSFHFIAKKQETNDFAEKTVIFTQNLQLGLGHGFEAGLKILPVWFYSYGGNVYLKYSGTITTSTSYGIICIGGYSEQNGEANNKPSEYNEYLFDTRRYYSYKKSAVISMNITIPITFSAKYISFTLAPNVGNYRSAQHYIYTADYNNWDLHRQRDIENYSTVNYIVPGFSALLSFSILQNNLIAFEVSAIRMEKTVIGFFGIGIGVTKNIF